MSHRKDHIFICMCVFEWVSVCVYVSVRKMFMRKKNKKEKEKRYEKKRQEKRKENLLIQIKRQSDRQIDRYKDRHKSFIDMRYNTEQYDKSDSIE